MTNVPLPERKTTSSSSPVPNTRSTVNNANGSELFSPTSAAAWALSTLHNFGALSRIDTRAPPVSEPITGTRLFNNAVLPTNERIGHLPITVPSKSDQSSNTGARNLHPNTHATAGVTWAQPQSQHTNQTTFSSRSPLLMRTNEMQSVAPGHIEKTRGRTIDPTSTVTPTPKKQKIDGSTSATYSRKKKSLGVLAENFINHFSKYPPGAVVIVDHAAVDLGVERRRIYDVVNILESVNLVEKKQKNTYSWMGMDHFDDFFGKLQAKAILEYPEDAKRYLDKSLPGDESTSKMRKNKENKSLAKLSEEFLQVFLVGFETLSLPEASDKIQGTTSMEDLIAMGGGARGKSVSGAIPDARELKAAAARGLKTKIRRLYDIANVFLSVGLLKKVENIDTSRRPNFSWNYRLSAQELYERQKRKMSGDSLKRPLQPDHCSSSLPETLNAIAHSVRNHE